MLKRIYSTVLILSIGLTLIPAQTKVYSIGTLKNIESIVREMNETVMNYGARNSWGDLERADVDSMEKVFDSMIESLDDYSEYSDTIFTDMLFSYYNYCEKIYSGDVDPLAFSKQIEIPFQQPLQAILSNRLKSEVKENIRRFNVRFGEQSERLNLLEMAVSITWFSPSTTDPVNSGPLHYEPILRFQSLGYQMNLVTNKVEVASPFIQVGLSYYFYGDTWIERTINHIGLAAAVQYDYSVKHLAAGAVLHVESYDIGILFNTKPKSNQTSIVFSGNVQLIKRWF